MDPKGSEEAEIVQGSYRPFTICGEYSRLVIKLPPPRRRCFRSALWSRIGRTRLNRLSMPHCRSDVELGRSSSFAPEKRTG